MKSKKLLALALFSITAGVRVYGEEEACSGEEIAWERKEPDADCCKQQRKSLKRCQRESVDTDKYTFESYLSPDIFRIYERFSSEEKMMAMDYADNHQMDPNDAVFEVIEKKNVY